MFSTVIAPTFSIFSVSTPEGRVHGRLSASSEASPAGLSTHVTEYARSYARTFELRFVEPTTSSDSPSIRAR